MVFADVEHGEAAFFHASRDQPIRVATDQEANVIADLDRLLALEFDKMPFAGDKILDLAFGCVIAGPKPFIGVQQQRRDEMRVEPAGDIAWLRGGDIVFA